MEFDRLTHEHERALSQPVGSPASAVLAQGYPCENRRALLRYMAQNPGMSLEPLTATVAAQAREEAKGLFASFLGQPLEEAGAIFADQIRLWRLQKEVRLLRKAKEILAAEGLTPKAVNLKTLLPLLDSAALEDDERMSDRWASLLASAADSNSKDLMESSFVEILKQLSPTDAHVLEVFYAETNRHKLRPDEWEGEHGIADGPLMAALKIEAARFALATDNLLRLRLLKYPTVAFGELSGTEARFPVTSAGFLCPTHLGQAFVTACNRGVAHVNTECYQIRCETTCNRFDLSGLEERLTTNL